MYCMYDIMYGTYLYDGYLYDIMYRLCYACMFVVYYESTSIYVCMHECMSNTMCVLYCVYMYVCMHVCVSHLGKIYIKINYS